MEEIWKDIEDYEGYYQISNLGNVKSLDYRRRGYSKNLTPKINNRGYAWVELAVNGLKQYFLIHRLVATAFIVNPNKYPIVNHIDENPLNNIVDNLEWCTSSYNALYSRERHDYESKIVRIGNRKTSTHRRRCESINQYTLDGLLIRKWEDSLQIRNNMNANQTSILECCEGKRKTAYGFKWEFAN